MPRSNEDVEHLKTELPPGAEVDGKLLKDFSYQVAFKLFLNNKFPLLICQSIFFKSFGMFSEEF